MKGILQIEQKIRDIKLLISLIEINFSQNENVSK